MLEGILFDCDGTLIDSEKHYLTAINETLKTLKFQIQLEPEEFLERWMLKQTNAPGLIQDYNLNTSVEKFREIKAKIFTETIEDKIEIMPYARELIREVHQKYPLGVVSSAWKDRLFSRLNKFNLTQFFQIIIGQEDVENTKPHPEPYVMGAKLLGITPSNIVAIEDTPSGAKSAKLAGCKVIAYPNGFTKNLDFNYADTLVSSLKEITPKYLQNLF